MTFCGFQYLCYSLVKHASAPSKSTQAIVLIKPVVFWDFVTRLASKFAKGTHPYSTSLMRCRNGAETNFPHGKMNNLAVAPCRWQTIVKHRWLGSILMHFRTKWFKTIQKALGLSLVSDAFPQNLKTFVLLRKRGGGIELKFHFPYNHWKPLQKSAFSEV